MENEKYLSRQQVAEILGVSPQTLAVWACGTKGRKRKKLPYYRFGLKTLYRESDVAAYIESCRREG